MKRLPLITALLVLLASLEGPCLGATNFNTSRSNSYRLTYPADLTTANHAEAMLAELDRVRPAGDARLKQWLAANFKRFAIDPASVKKVVLLRPGKAGRQTSVILLTDPADEAQAVATTVKSGKSNSSC
jgi:hypothetical protein